MEQALAAPVSVFAVVSTADVVVRLIAVCVEYVRRCRSASDVMPKLLRELIELSVVSTKVKLFQDDYNNSRFAREDHKPLHDFETLLRDCETELEALKDVATTLVSASTDSWYSRLPKSLSWGAKSHDFEKNRSRLEHLKSDLLYALSVTGRYVCFFAPASPT